MRMASMTGEDRTAGTTAYLLGAGFSKAFEPSMPLMADLRDLVLNALGLPASTLDPFGGDLEAWLSYLSSHQPWDDESTAWRNRATFREVSRAVAAQVRTAQGPRRGTGAHDERLTRLVLDWCVQKAHVLTFNYDLVVERVLQEWESNLTGGDIYPLPLTERRAPLAGIVGGQGSPRIPLPHLYKLHGSVNWHYPGLSQGQGPVTLGPWEPVPADTQRERDRHLYDDLEPLVVPPTSVKSAYYDNDALRALWRNASEGVSSAHELVVIGYSFPPSDQQVLSFVRTTLPAGAVILIVTADQRVADRAREMFPGHEVQELVAPDAASQYVDEVCGPLIKWNPRWEDNCLTEHLEAFDTVMRRTEQEAHDNTTTDSSRVLEELQRSWPTLPATWQPAFTASGRESYRGYVPWTEWAQAPLPWPRSAQPRPKH